MTTKPTTTATARRTANNVYINKQQLCTYFTLFFTFLRRRSTTMSMKLWNFLISRARIMSSWTKHKHCRFLFLNLDNDRYGPKETFAKICQILMKLNKIGEVWNSPNRLLSDFFGFVVIQNFCYIVPWQWDVTNSLLCNKTALLFWKEAYILFDN